MKTKVSPAIIGFFVLGAVALGAIALLSFGSVNLFNKPPRFVVYFNESIQGLDIGSPVKIRGMRIGRVADVQIRHVPGSHQSLVAVICEINRDKVTSTRGVTSKDEPGEGVRRLINDGLRAQLGILGLATGMLYVELDFLDPVANPAVLHPELDSPYQEIPAVPSAIAQIQTNLSDILNQFKDVKFGDMANDVQKLIAELRIQFEKADISGLIGSVTQAAQSVHNLADSPDVKETLASIKHASARLSGLLDDVGKNLDPLTADAEKTLVEARSALKEFATTAASTRQFLDNQQTLGVEAGSALLRLGRAADAISRLADFLERNPTALLTGRPPEKQ
ncbi:MlaD family protein [Geminisphaera colitermitum]|uniref:MlaD family protein n=1 Tax=Geminisphaera colitermitum TaxID=1148786 RepID=UPI0005BC8820|nr:MlaD family protein [Geminisphaera colitermitum]